MCATLRGRRPPNWIFEEDALGPFHAFREPFAYVSTTFLGRTSKFSTARGGGGKLGKSLPTSHRNGSESPARAVCVCVLHSMQPLSNYFDPLI